VFLGEDILVWLVLAFGGAMFAGNVLAVVKPPKKVAEGSLAQAPRSRSLAMAALWALLSLVS
jgi:predicted PhzF superfamily epimerase YddE/YHI9